jgi:hypothetical protein
MLMCPEAEPTLFPRISLKELRYDIGNLLVFSNEIVYNPRFWTLRAYFCLFDPQMFIIFSSIQNFRSTDGSHDLL